MLRETLGVRVRNPHFIHYSPARRIGDLAFMAVFLSNWRESYPDVKLTYYWHSFPDYMRDFPVSWMFNGCVDELVRGHPEGEVEGIQIRFGPSHWNLWRHYRFFIDRFPTISPPEDVSASLVGSDPYILFHPLFSAGYHKWRNAPLSWWEDVLDRLTGLNERIFVVGVPPETVMRLPSGVEPLYKTPLSVSEMLSLVAKAKCFIGGETGFPLWACIFRVPVVFCARNWRTFFRKGRSASDYRPIDFGAPVSYAPVGGDPRLVSNIIKQMVKEDSESTYTVDFGLRTQGWGSLGLRDDVRFARRTLEGVLYQEITSSGKLNAAASFEAVGDKEFSRNKER